MPLLLQRLRPASHRRARREEQARLDREDRFRLLVENVPDYAILMLDKKGKVASWNLGAQRLKGYAAREIIGRHFSIFFPPADISAKKPQRELNAALEKGRFETEGWRVRKDGRKFWANVVLTPVRDQEGRHVGFANVTRDLTQQRKTAEALRASEDRQRLLIQGVKDYAIFSLDPKGVVSSWNAGAERIKGYKAQEIIGKHFSKFYPAADIKAGKPDWELRVATAEGRFEDEGWRLRKDGSLFWANVVITPIWSERGAQLLGFTKVTRDLTERRNAEESLRRSNQQLEQYASFVSHDLQEPLRKMASFAELLERRYKDRLGPEADRYIHYIVDAAQRMRTLITEVLEFSRLGRGAPAIKPVPLNAVLDTVKGDLEVALREAGGRLLVGKLPVVRGDAVLLARLFQNLLGNSIKFRRPGRRLRVSVGAKREKGGWLIWVKDNGIGFDDADAAQIFEPFKRLNRAQEYPGTGLGLSVSRKIAEIHGWGIVAHGRPGRGATFCVKLPS